LTLPSSKPISFAACTSLPFAVRIRSRWSAAPTLRALRFDACASCRQNETRSIQTSVAPFRLLNEKTARALSYALSGCDSLGRFNCPDQSNCCIKSPNADQSTWFSTIAASASLAAAIFRPASFSRSCIPSADRRSSANPRLARFRAKRPTNRDSRRRL